MTMDLLTGVVQEFPGMSLSPFHYLLLHGRTAGICHDDVDETHNHTTEFSTLFSRLYYGQITLKTKT